MNTATETVVAPEFRCPNEDAAWRLFERLQALAEELGIELTHAGVVAADVYDEADDD